MKFKGQAQAQLAGWGGGKELGTWALKPEGEQTFWKGETGPWELGPPSGWGDGLEAGPSGAHSSACVQPSLSKPWNHHLCPAPSFGPQGPR